MNAKNVAFRVDKQIPDRSLPPQPFATVINCRKPGGKRAKRKQQVRSQQVPLTRVAEPQQGISAKRKRTPPDEDERETTSHQAKRPRSSPGSDDITDSSSNTNFANSATSTSITDSSSSNNFPNSVNSTSIFDISQGNADSPGTPSGTESPRPFPVQRQRNPEASAKIRRGRALKTGPPDDVWACILDVTSPDQLLKLRSKLPVVYDLLKNRTHIWCNSRKNWSDTLPDPPAGLNEFQYADLRHGSGCMSCRTKSTRKTYWTFMRRWCKTCLQSKTIKEHDAMALFKDHQDRDISDLRKCIPSAVFDSWGNYVGVGPPDGVTLKLVYLMSDVRDVVAEYNRLSQGDVAFDRDAWMARKAEAVATRRDFARKMEFWEETTRSSRSSDYQAKKDHRKDFFREQAGRLLPPINVEDMCQSSAYKRAVAIPREPTMNSWLQLKPKLEKEVAELRAGKQPASTQSGQITNPSTPSRMSNPIGQVTNPPTPSRG